MTFSISDFNSTQIQPRKTFEAARVTTGEFPAAVEWAKPTSEEELQARLAADNAKTPDAVWGEVVSGGRVIAKVYETGGFAYYGSGEVNIDTNVSAEETARQLMSLYGGRLQRVQSGSVETYF